MNRSMDNDQMPDRDPEDDELARRLEAYAQTRLSPSLAATTRMRTQVMAAAHRLAAAEIAARPTVMRRPSWRRPVSALLAACLTLALIVGSVAAARPGGPLYGTRIWAEALTLPSSAAERATTEVRRLQERLAEAAAATAAGDTNAANAALEAYGAIVSEATTGADVSAAATATLGTGIRRNIQVLTILAERVPKTGQAQDAITHAIERSTSAVDGLRGEPGVGGQPPANPGKAPEPGATNRSEHSANPNKPTPDPADATPKHQENATPKPQPTPKPGGKPSSPPGEGYQGS
jgi:hypothetical protein